MKKLGRAKDEMEESMLLDMAAEVLSTLMFDEPIATTTATCLPILKQTTTEGGRKGRGGGRTRKNGITIAVKSPAAGQNGEASPILGVGQILNGRKTVTGEELEHASLLLPPLVETLSSSYLPPSSPQPILPASAFPPSSPTSSSAFLLSSASATSSTPIPTLSLRSSTSAFSTFNSSAAKNNNSNNSNNNTSLPGLASFDAKADLATATPTPFNLPILPHQPLQQQQQQQPMQLLFHHIQPATAGKQQTQQTQQLQRQQRLKGALGQAPKRRRRKTTAAECAILKAAFDAGMYHPPLPLRKELALAVGMTERQIQVWFQNRRQKLKKGLLPSSPSTPNNIPACVSPFLSASQLCK